MLHKIDLRKKMASKDSKGCRWDAPSDEQLKVLKTSISGVDDLFVACGACREIIRSGGRKGRFNRAVNEFGWGHGPLGFTCTTCKTPVCAGHFREKPTITSQRSFLTKLSEAERQKMTADIDEWSKKLIAGNPKLAGFCPACQSIQ